MSQAFAWLMALLAVLLPGFPAQMAAPPAAQPQSSPAGLPAAAARPYKVAIQIGHYKNNEMPDALSRLVGSTGTAGGGRTEVDLNADAANRVAKLLRAQDMSVEILPATVPTGYTADVFVAIHADGNASSKPRGFKISTRWRSEVAVQDARLVELMTGTYQAATGLPEDSAVTRNMRGYYAYASWQPNWRVSNFTPGAIVEMGYMSNAADRAVMFNQTDKVARGIADGITAFLKEQYGAPGASRPYGYGLVDDDIDPNADRLYQGRPPSGSGSAQSTPSPYQTGNWKLVLMGRDTISVYTGAGGVGPVVTRVARGTILPSTMRRGDYYQVTLPSGKVGWIHRNAVVVQM